MTSSSQKRSSKIDRIVKSRKPLDESLVKYRMIFEHSPELIILVDGEGYIIDINRRVTAWFGLQPQKIIGTLLADLPFLTPKSSRILHEKFSKRMQGRKLKPYLLDFINKDGKTGVGKVIGAAIPDNKGKFIGDLLIISDATAQIRLSKEREAMIAELQNALNKVKTLNGLIPICASCKKIRDDRGYWQEVEAYLSQHSDAKFTHGLCQECLQKLYPDQYENILKRRNEDH